MNGLALQAVLTVLFGALAGGLTNSLAIWMVFHPYAPPRLFGRRIRYLQGAIPKNKERLAAAIGRTVGTRLLTADDLARTVRAPQFRDAFDERLAAFLDAALQRPRGSLVDELPAPLHGELRDLLAEAVDGVVARLDAYLASDAFRDEARSWAETLLDDLADRPVAEVLTPEREAALVDAAERWLADAVGREGLERAVRDTVDRAADRLLQPDNTVQDVLPTELVGALEQAIASYLPIALERLADLLEEPGARAQLERVLHEILDRFVRDLKFHQRLVAVLFITPGTVDRVIRAIEEEGADKISEVLDDPAVRDAMADRISAGVADLLARPVTSVVGEPGDPAIGDAKQALADRAVAFARGERTREHLIGRLRAVLGAATDRTWGELLRRVPPDRIADAIVATARSGEARAVYRNAIERLAGRALDTPIGRPADILPPDTAVRLERAVADPLWQWLQDEMPDIARRVDVAGRVEQKILDYPMERVEDLVRSVTARELHLIVRLGYLLGGVIGATLVAVNALLA